MVRTQIPANHFSETWIPLERWCLTSALTSPVFVPGMALPTWSLQTPQGSFIFCPGNPVAHWSGIELHLGFAPQAINRQPFLHTLDLSKTVLPLFSTSSPLYSNSHPVLVLDPGHGGQDSGAASTVDRMFEKQFTLDWARRVQRLAASSGWTVLLTRSNDVEIPLSRRVAFAEQHKADLFLSLHFNSAPADRAQAGLETYCLTPAGMPSSITRGYGDDPSLTFPNNEFDAQNFQLALQIHRRLLEVNGHHDRGVRRARFLGVLRPQQRPAVLVEGGYLSNPREARLIADPGYREKLAEAVVEVLGTAN